MSLKKIDYIAPVICDELDITHEKHEGIISGVLCCVLLCSVVFCSDVF